MLDLMRRHAKSWLIKAALFGIIITFIFWYGWSGPVEQNQGYVAKVNDTVITVNYFENIYNSELEKLRLRFKGAMPPELPKKLNLKKKVIQALVNQVLLLDEARRLGLYVTDEDLVNDIRNTPIFTRNGVFDDYAYRAYLREIKLNPTMYEMIRRKQLLEMQVVGILTDGAKTDPGEVKRLWHFQNDKLKLAAIFIKADQMKQAEPPKERELQEFYERNKSNYEIPPAVDMEYVAFSWKDLKDKVTVPEKEARDYYETHPKEFVIPEKVHVRQILLKIPEKAVDRGKEAKKPDPSKIEEVKKELEKIVDRIKGGEDFKKVAKEVSQDERTAKSGGDLGFVARGYLEPEIEELVFKLKPGEVSEPILTKQGWRIMFVEEKQEEKLKEFDEVKADIITRLQEKKARRKARDIADDLYEQVYRSEDLEAPAKRLGFTIKRAKFVTRAGGVPGVGNDEKLMDEAFGLKESETSRLVNVGDDYVLMKILKVIDARIPELDEVRKAVVKDLMQERALEAARKKAEKIIEALEEEPDKPDEVAARFGVKWEQLDPLSRTTGLVPRLGNAPEVNEMLTTVSPASPLFPSPIDVTGGVAVVRLSGVERASDERYKEEAQVFADWIRELRRREFLEGWLRRLKKTATIDIQARGL